MKIFEVIMITHNDIILNNYYKFLKTVQENNNDLF